MKNILLLLLCLLALNSAFSQDKFYFNYGIEITPKIITQNVENEELVETSATIGAASAYHVYFNINSRLSIKSGLGINIIRFEQKDYSIRFGSDMVNGSFDPYNSWEVLDYSIFYLTFPAHIKWNITQQKHHPYVRTGLDVLVKLGDRGSSTIYEGGNRFPSSDSPRYNFNDVLIVPGIGLGYEFSLKEESQLYIEPSIEFAVSPIFYEDSPVIGTINIEGNSNLLNYGIAVGLIF